MHDDTDTKPRHVTLNNEQSSLAEDAKAALLLSAKRSGEAAVAFVDAGKKLLAAKEITPHGQWAAVLNRADISPRQAQRAMDCAKLGLKNDIVSLLGIAVLQGLARYLRRQRKAYRAFDAYFGIDNTSISNRVLVDNMFVETVLRDREVAAALASVDPLTFDADAEPWVLHVSTALAIVGGDVAVRGSGAKASTVRRTAERIVLRLAIEGFDAADDTAVKALSASLTANMTEDQRAMLLAQVEAMPSMLDAAHQRPGCRLDAGRSARRRLKWSVRA